MSCLSPHLLRPAFLLAAALWLAVGLRPAYSQFLPVWSVGLDDQTNAEFGDEWAVDDEFTVGEPTGGLERAITKDEPFTHILFSLTETQRGALSRLRLRVDLCGPGWMIPNGTWLGQGWHDVRISLNGVVLKNALTLAGDQTTLSMEVDAATVPLLATNNILRLERTGGSDLTPAGAPSWTWIGIDYVSLEVDSTALTDPDGDGLPSWWERHWLRSPTLAGAAADADLDGLSDSAEFAAGTDPDGADTDGDGLTDSAEAQAAPPGNPLLADADLDGLTDAMEISATPATSPALADTDGDGASDAWERHMGTNPTVATSLPPVFNQAVGLDFVQRRHASAPAPSAVAGVVPQPFWNATRPAAPWAPTLGNMNQVAQPSLGVLRDSAGAISPITATWTSPQASFDGSTGSPDGQLLEGFLCPDETTPAVVTLSNIPYATYDVIVCLAARSNQHRGYAQIAGQPTTRRFYLALSQGPFSRWQEATTTQAEMDAAAAGTTIPEEINRRRQVACRSGNYVRFRNRSGASVSVEVRHDLWSAGIAAIQIVDTAADRDGDGMVDSYEFAHGLSPAVADGTLDRDGDGLTNLQEHTSGSHPALADTDGDGLADGAESAANRLTVDGDGDGLSDAAETHAVRPTNPQLADSDGDGLTDTAELENASDPLSPNGAARPVPVYSNPGPTGSPTWLWEADAQFIIDHGSALLTASGFGPRAAMHFMVVNANDPNSPGIIMELRAEAGKLAWLFHTGRTGAFSGAGDSANSGWYADWNNEVNLAPLLGFSGFGANDISDRLRFRLEAVRPTGANQWNLTFQILNLDNAPAQQAVLTRTFSNTTAAASLNNGSATWVSHYYPPSSAGVSSVYTLPGISAWLGYPALETLPAFASAKDTDEDGLPDTWEDTHTLNKNDASDAIQDADSDGLSNRAEWLARTLPRTADTDADGVRDGDELTSGSDPLLATSRPPFFQTAPPTGEDLNGNGLPDLWETWVGSWSLSPTADSDQDGLSNLQESQLGTHPMDPSSWLEVEWQNTLPSTSSLRWTNLPHKRHRLLTSQDNFTWDPLSASPATAGAWRSLAIPSPASTTEARRFYRPEITDQDQDADGLSDWAEEQLGTSPLAANSAQAALLRDTNLDGLPDATLAGDYAAFAARIAPAATTSLSLPQASRLLHQATFGPTMPDIHRLAAMGAAPWITEQINLPPTWHSPYIRQIYADFFGQQTDRTYNGSDQDSFLFGNNVSTPFFRAAVAAPDQLRQRVAFALSQILVASRRDAALENTPLGLADFYDIFVRHAFGNYADILRDVSLHPVMGRYLSHIGNQKANPAINQYPDENYAREVMQLFSIGLWELHPNGTRQLTPAGDPIPTYSNSQITEFARVFTGLWFGGMEWLEGGWNDANYAVPMDMFPDAHDFGQKTLLSGTIIPARAPTRENALQDVRDAIQCLFQHPNTPVFVSRQLIQFLVTSNPSPAYVQRVQTVFTNNGHGVRGDMAAIIRAILMDPEARDPRWSLADPDFGKLREPVIRTMHLARAGGLARLPAPVWWNWGDFFDAMKQEVLFSPSVFNFYRPDYKAPGLLSQKNLNGPVFQITDSYSAISLPNKLWDFIHSGMSPNYPRTYPLDFPEEITLAGHPTQLLDRLNLVLCAGRLSATTRATILSAIEELPATEARARVHLAVYLCLTAPEGAIQR